MKINTLPERLTELEQSHPILAKDMRPCRKKPIIIKATQMDAAFRVQTIEGDYKLGKPGDYLMCGVEEELYICDKHIFEKTYNWI